MREPFCSRSWQRPRRLLRRAFSLPLRPLRSLPRRATQAMAACWFFLSHAKSLSFEASHLMPFTHSARSFIAHKPTVAVAVETLETGAKAETIFF